jgi:hypothetical protein
LDHGSAVVQTVFHPQVEAKYDDAGQLRGGSHDPLQLNQLISVQDILKKKIPAGVAGDTQFWKDDDGSATLVSLLYACNDLVGVELRICHSNDRRDSSSPDQSQMFHGDRLLWFFLLYNEIYSKYSRRTTENVEEKVATEPGFSI